MGIVYHVYVDWTTESEARPFYVGKGSSQRVRYIPRNPKHRAIAVAYGLRREVVLSTEDERVAFERERQLIAEFRTRAGYEGHWGANFTDGGEGPSGRKHSEASKLRMRHPHRPFQQDTKIRMSLSQQKRWDAIRAGISPKPRITDEVRLKCSQGHKRRRPVRQSLNGTLIEEFSSLTDASLKTGVANSHISECCKGQRKTAGGFVWEYR